MHTIGEKRIRMLNPREIKKPPYSVRQYIEERDLYLLRDSIAASGVLQPLLVKKIGRKSYQLISGERRLKAAILAGLRRVPCVVHNVNDNTALIYSLAENVQWKEISPFDIAKSLDILINKKGISLTETAIRLGITPTVLTEKLKILRLEKRLIERMSLSGLTEKHALALLRIQKEGRAQILDRIIAEGLTPKQTEDYIFSVLNPPLSKEEKKEPPKTQEEKPLRKLWLGDPRLFSNSLLKMIDALKNGGIKVNYRKTESEKYTEYKIKIEKGALEQEEFTQLKICQ